MCLHLAPISLKDARQYIADFHRHHKPPQGHKFSIAVRDEALQLRGVVIVGRPVARMLDDGYTAEVTRQLEDRETVAPRSERGKTMRGRKLWLSLRWRLPVNLEPIRALLELAEKATPGHACLSSTKGWNGMYCVSELEHPRTIGDFAKLEDAKHFVAARNSTAAISQLLEAVTWQPIETAPKTGEHILAAIFDGSIGFGYCKVVDDGTKAQQSMQAVVHWWDNPGEAGWYCSVDSVGEFSFPATHWKPLNEL